MTDSRQLHVFLCHAHEDKEQVRDLYIRLSAIGIDAWLDEEKLIAGQNFDHEIHNALKNSDAILICLSKKSVSKSGYVNKEIKVALDLLDIQPEGSIFLIPTRLDDTVVPSRLEHLQWVDLFSGNGYQQLVKALEYRARELEIRLVSPSPLFLNISTPSKEEELTYKTTIAARTAWTAEIIHDVNREIGRIRAKLFLIRRTIDEKDEVAKLASEIDNHVEALGQIVDWNLSFTETFVLDEFLYRTITAMLDPQNIAVEFNLNTKDALVNLQSSYLARVFRHLVRNSAKAMENMANRKIKIETQLIENGKVQILFTDFGPGIPENIRTKIFNEEIPSSSQRGYGLLFVRQIVEGLGGQITLLPSQPNCGANFLMIFSVKLPDK